MTHVLFQLLLTRATVRIYNYRIDSKIIVKIKDFMIINPNKVNYRFSEGGDIRNIQIKRYGNVTKF
jgi:hypothetical protein